VNHSIDVWVGAFVVCGSVCLSVYCGVLVYAGEMLLGTREKVVVEVVSLRGVVYVGVLILGPDVWVRGWWLMSSGEYG